MGLTGDKHLLKIIFDIKIGIDIFEILDVPNFDKSREKNPFLILGTFYV